MTWTTRFLHLLIIWLLAGPLATPGWTLWGLNTRLPSVATCGAKEGLPSIASNRAEEGVGGSPVFSSAFASPASSQVAESHQENSPDAYDFASGVHKYLYCHGNPVNGTDPTGHDLNAGSMAGSMAGRTGLATTSSSTIGRALVTSRNLIGRSMVQAVRLRMGDPTEYLASRLLGAGLSVGTVGVGLGLGLAFEDSEETKGRVLYRGMSGDSMPDLLPEGETEAGKYLGIRPKDIKDVQNGTVMPTAQGLSVTPNNPSLMHPFILGKIAEGKARVWGIYEGLLDPRLMVRPDPENLKGHAFIGVAAPMSVAEFKRLIAETQRMWSPLSP